MRVTYAGTYAWENDSIIAVTFTKEKRFESNGFSKLGEDINKRLKISDPKGKSLTIQRAR